jgi:hypothetical protein
MAQAAECLPHKLEALNSNSSTVKKANLGVMTKSPSMGGQRGDYCSDCSRWAPLEV